MKRVPALAVTAVLAAVPATVGVAALATDGGAAGTPTSQPASRHSPEPGDDNGGDRSRDQRHEAGDDHGGHGDEPGDDHGGDDGDHDD